MGLVLHGFQTVVISSVWGCIIRRSGSEPGCPAIELIACRFPSHVLLRASPGKILRTKAPASCTPAILTTMFAQEKCPEDRVPQVLPGQQHGQILGS